MGILFSKLFEGLFGQKEIQILMVGLENAGKTTILYKLKLNEFVETIPTIGINLETVQYKNISFKVWDLSARIQITPFRRYYFQNTKCLIFVIDTNDRLHIEDAKADLMNLLDEDELKNALLLVFANKQDLPNAMSADELTEILGLNQLTNRNWFIQNTCAINGDGLNEGFDWLLNQL